MKIIKSFIRSGKKEIDEYIEELETFNCSNIQRLVQACDDLAGVIADDIVKISTSDKSDEDLDGELTMLGSKRSKSYERFLSLVGNLRNFKAITDINSPQAVKISPVKNKVLKVEEMPEEHGEEIGNTFESISERVKKRISGS